MPAMITLQVAAANHWVLARQHLTPPAASAAIVDIARDAGGLHATGMSTPYLSLFARAPGFRRADLDEALYARRTLAKIRCVRKTVYVHPIDAIPFVYAATAGLVAGISQRFMEGRGVSPAEFQRLSEAIVELLQGREMGATAIRQALQTRADVSSVLNLLCDRGVLIRARPLAGWQGKSQAYALFAEWFPGLDLQAMPEEEARRLLARHYLAAFGPALPEDVEWWTGLGKRAVQQALRSLAGEVQTVALAGLPGEYLILRADEPGLAAPQPVQEPVVNLLPMQDPYLMGYKNRERYLDERHRPYVFDPWGNATSTLLIAGRVAGVWDAEAGEPPTVKVLLFEAVADGIRGRILEAARGMGRFIFGQDVRVAECTSMVPLTERTAGSMMSPLRGC